MKITASAISLNVDDVAGSAAFAKDHFGFREEMAAEGFVSLSREDAGFNLETEPWGERFFQVTDPSGIVIQLVQWMAETKAEPSGGAGRSTC